MDQTGIIFNIMRYAISDGPGIRTTVFFKGCPLACQWCHNPESQSPDQQLIIRSDRCLNCGACIACCPVGGDPAACRRCGRCAEICPAGARELLGREISVPAVMAELEKDRLFYEESGGGVTFSGGEPLYQAAFLLALLQASKEQGFHTAVDTCGYGPFSALAATVPFTDLYLYDLKLMDPDAHQYYTGVSNVSILSNLEQLTKSHGNVRIRTPLAPGLTDGNSNLEAMAAFLQPLAISEIEILPYHNTALSKYQLLGRPYLQTPRPSQDQLEQAKNILAASGHKVLIGGTPNE